MATETFRETMNIYGRKKVVSDKFIYNPIYFSNENRETIQKVYFLKFQYFIALIKITS